MPCFNVFLKKMEAMRIVDKYRREFEKFLNDNIKAAEPANLYKPMDYILGLGGKRIRPVLALLTTELYGTDHQKALPAALALELFHNFSLVHDDIMDAAPLRRGKITVHNKWDVNTAILSGDAMLIRSYQFFDTYEPVLYKKLVEHFTHTAFGVCEGQQYDVDFESRNDVTLDEYIHMIDRKTAILIGAAMKMGALIAGAPSDDIKAIYDFGRNLGIAFQLQDDYLDAFGDPDLFGKQVGGDIIENKKTILYLNALQIASPSTVKNLKKLFSGIPGDPEDKVHTVKAIYSESGAAEQTQQQIQEYTESAFEKLEHLQLASAKKAWLRQLGDALMNREV